MATEYRVLVDWGGAGVYDKPQDVMPVLERDGVTIRAGRDRPRRFNPTRPSEASWNVDNRSRFYSDPSTGLFGDLVPFRQCKIQSVNPDGTFTDLFNGVVDNWSARLDNYPAISADFDATDRLALLANTFIRTPLLNGLRTDQAVAAILDGVGWPTTKRNLAVGYTTLGYWWADGRNALQLLQEIADHEQGWFYVDPTGVLVFESRYSRVDRVTAGAGYTATWDDLRVSRVEWRTGVKDVVNRVTVTTEQYAPDATPSQIWEHGTRLSLSSGEYVQLHFRASSPFTNPITPQAGVDFTLVGGSVNPPQGFPFLTQESATTGVLEITAGPSGAILDGLRVRATQVRATKPVSWTFEDTFSQFVFGLRALEVRLSHLATPLVGRDAAQAILNRYAFPVEAVDVSLKAPTNTSNANLTDALKIKLSDRVNLSLDAIGARWAGFVEGVKHHIRYGLHTVTYTVEKSTQESVFVLDDDVYGLLDDTAILGW